MRLKPPSETGTRTLQDNRWGFPSMPSTLRHGHLDSARVSVVSIVTSVLMRSPVQLKTSSPAFCAQCTPCAPMRPTLAASGYDVYRSSHHGDLISPMPSSMRYAAPPSTGSTNPLVCPVH